MADAKVTMQAAWRRFAEAAADGATLVEGASCATDERMRAEGHRYFARLLAAGVQEGFGHQDPAFPAFFRGLDDRAPWGAPNLDNVYLRATVDARYVYRISGNVSELHGFLINLNEGVFPYFPGYRTSCEISHRELTIGADGAFELILGGPERPGNWLPLGAKDRGFSIRQYLYDWSRHRPAAFNIERIGGEGEAPAAPAPATVAATLDAATDWALTTARYYLGRLEKERAAAPVNTLPAPERRVPGSAYAHYGVGFYELEPEQALYIEMPAGDAANWPYWGFQLYSLWNEAVDPFHHQASLNGHQASIGEDGIFRAAIAHRDPGIANWLDTSGLAEGYVWYRWFWADSAPAPRARLMAVDEVREQVPRGQWLDGAGRAEALALRRRQLQARYQR